MKRYVNHSIIWLQVPKHTLKMSYKLLLPVSVIHKGTRFQLARMLPRHIPEVEVIVEQTIRAGYGMSIVPLVEIFDCILIVQLGFTN